MKKLFDRIKCLLGFHNVKPATLKAWRARGCFFYCTRCGKEWDKQR